MKRRNFLHMAATGASSAALLHASSTGLAQTAQSAPSDSSSRILIVYYSRKGENYAPGGVQNLAIGHTARMAQYIADVSHGDLYEIQTVNAYPSNYRETTRVAESEISRGVKPELLGAMPDISKYDIIFLGHPIWWSQVPPAVSSFLDKVDLSGKKVVQFCTHAGSGFGSSIQQLKAAHPKATFLETLAITGTEVSNSRARIEAWATKVLK